MAAAGDDHTGTVKPVDEATLRDWGERLRSAQTPLVEKYRCLFGLRHAKEPAAVDWIGAAFADQSALLKHELAYVLGQKADARAVAVLLRVLADEGQPIIVRHEAAEALGAIGTEEALTAVTKLAESPQQELAETCQLAVRRIAWLRRAPPEELRAAVAACDSVDPAPPADTASETVAALAQRLSDPSAPLYERYRAMFALRNVARADASGGAESEAAVAALGAALACPESALFRHEVAFVLGQLGHPAATDDLIGRLADQSEHGMVRHEAAEALGAIGSPRCVAKLREYLADPEVLVRESCVVALDIADYLTGEEFQYARVPAAK